ncbi:SusD/RagB family nutrient-binding outer membrane lipoprotein [Hymenobacter sp. BT175]|uniref:SusD/RagB family nutrient-binding outer membrane lipoprotein n=1 Tax=Hymenobacter translucens TaxID=2886507 RepID=UPI001D0E3A89|nr:SusD/RagB family nutrient-binding outer membrane lipoprotein [Hymenobacter translucens]MCC2547000.1 SusD/RagB family nutrient-binding outer membrane lipoprotein [Hymenobacter translucens]
MKNLTKYVLLAALGLSLGSCDKFINGNDINPNAPQDAPADQQLTAAQLSEGFFMSGEIPRQVGIWSGFFTGADRQYLGLDLYNTAAGDYDNAWSLAYATTLAQTRLVEEKAQAVNNRALLGVAQVVEAQIVGQITALWGDVPYSEALRPGTPGKFDSQASVYAATQTLLDQAIINLPLNGVWDRSRDIFYGGSVPKWTAAAHSLKARHYLHVKDYARAASEARLGITSSANDMIMPYNGTSVSGDLNPYYDFIDINRFGYMSAEGAHAAALLDSVGSAGGRTRANAKTDESARFSYFYIADQIYSLDPNFVDGAFAPDADAPLLTYVETQAILAEALNRTGDQAGALAALNNIRRENETKFGPGAYAPYVLADFAAGGLMNRVAGQTPAAAMLKEILTEKYLSMIGQLEPFHDLRRTDNLIGVPKKNSASPSLPQRLLYPQSEVNTNPNVPKPIPGLFDKTPVNR